MPALQQKIPSCSHRCCPNQSQTRHKLPPEAITILFDFLPAIPYIFSKNYKK